MNTSVAQTLYNQAVSDNGGTSWLHPDRNYHGYVVALAGYEMRLSVELLKVSTIEYYIKNMMSASADGVGIWVDGGFAYIDSVTHQDTLDYAKWFGTQQKQLAIYDITNATVIDL